MHPLSGFDDILWKKKCSYRLTLSLIAVFMVSEIFREHLFGFQFYAVSDRTFSIIPYIFRTFVLFIIWSAGNWSVCCLLDGKGTFKNICAVSAYALTPYIIQNFLTTLLSHFLITDEGFILTALTSSGLLWSSLMMFSAVKSVHQYSNRRTLAAIILTILAMITISFLIILMIMMFSQIYVFLYAVYTEIVYRIKL